MAKIQAIRGMNDILPDDTPNWQFIERCFQDVVSRYGYREIRFPVLELTQLFKRSIGEVTDIVEKEMYSFDDRNGDNLSLRPEGTAGCVRSAEQHGLLYNQQQRLWYHGPMFRHERPQKGRYRQFYQFGIEAFGMPGPDIDAEVILLSAAYWQALDLTQAVKLEINNIGNGQDRQRFGEALRRYLESRKQSLDADSLRRLDSNPLRILDSKDAGTREILKDAPLLSEFVNPDSRAHYQDLQALLTDAGVEYEENPSLVRGLDYYNNAVFEWKTGHLGSQSTVCAGGRYDALVQQLGGKATPAVGFAMGQERLVLLLEDQGKQPVPVSAADVYLVIADPTLTRQGLNLSEKLRRDYPQLKILLHCGGGKYNSQMKKAYNSGARVALVLGSDTDDAATAANTIRLKRLDESGETVTAARDKLGESLDKMLTP